MSYSTRYRPGSAITVTLDDRVAFIRKTYAHLAGAIGFFVLCSWALWTSGAGNAMASALFGGSSMGWIVFMLVFMAAGYGAQAMARNSYSRGVQYAGLGLYALLEALIFAPFLALIESLGATQPGYQNILAPAAIITLAVFTGLTGFVLIYNKDFSFLGGFITVGFMAAIGIAIVAMLFGLDIGIWYSAGVIVLASMAVLYSTSNILRYYPPDMYVAAALELFAEIALLFWYILRLLMQMQRR